MKEKGLLLKKKKNKQEADDIPHKLWDTDNTYDLALLANTPAQAESLLYRMKQIVIGIGLYVNSDFSENLSDFS